eukprot:763137-Hanusia_phi.AAC.2
MERFVSKTESDVAHCRLGDLYLKVGKYQNALVSYHNALSAHPGMEAATIGKRGRKRGKGGRGRGKGWRSFRGGEVEEGNEDAAGLSRLEKAMKGIDPDGEGELEKESYESMGTPSTPRGMDVMDR